MDGNDDGRKMPPKKTRERETHTKPNHQHEDERETRRPKSTNLDSFSGDPIWMFDFDRVLFVILYFCSDAEREKRVAGKKGGMERRPLVVAGVRGWL